MKITFLGTGTSTGIPVIGCHCVACQSSDPKDKRLRASVLIEHQNTCIAIDCGPDFRQQMLRANVHLLDAILFTHQHRDHTAGLDDIRPFFYWQGGKNMQVFASTAVQADLKSQFAYIFAEKKYPGAPAIDLHTISKNEAFSFQDFSPIIPIEVIHGTMPVLGFRFGNFTYLTDVKYIDDIEKEKVKGTEILVISAVRKSEPHWSHLTLPEALAFIDEWQPKQAYLTHLSHKMGPQQSLIKDLPPNVQIAYDGLVLELDSM